MNEKDENKEIQEEKDLKSTITQTKTENKVKIDFEKIHQKNLENDEEEYFEEENEEQNEKKNNKKTNSNKNNKKMIIIGVISVIIVIFLIVLSTIFALLNINNSNIMSGISIKGIDVSGLSKEDAKAQLETIFSEKLNKDISIKYQDYVSEISPTAIEANYNLDEALDEAYNIGRDSNIIVNNYKILKALILKDDIDVKCTINEEIAKNTIDGITSKLPGAVIQSDYYREENNLIITKGKSGIAVDTDKFLNNITNNLNDLNAKDDYLEIPVMTINPNEIDIDKIYEEVYTEVADAYYTTDPFTLHQEVEGIDFDVEAAKEMLKEDKDEYTIPLNVTKPKVTLDQIGTEAFPDLLATFSTKYDASNTNRTTNLRLAANKINGTVLMPGSEFSYNKVVGERTIAAGYKEAKIYSAGQVVDGLGGGICQISSTLYNSVVFANLDITSRRNHQFVTSYVPAGRDATVVYGSQDFKFKNTRKFPVKITASVKGGVATISIYGIKEENEYDISFQVNTISTIPYSVSYVDDASIEKGKEVVKQNGANGIITETYKIVRQNGKVVSKTLLSKDTYNAMKKIIARGTKGSATSTTTPSNNNQSNNNTQQPETQVPETQQPEVSTPTTSTPNTPEVPDTQEPSEPEVTEPSDDKEESSEVQENVITE